MLKVVYFFNWICIGILALFVLLMLLDPHKSGGDAATRGMGTAVLYLGLAALVVLLGLNLLPWQWSKYTAFALVMAPLIFFAVTFSWAAFQRANKVRIEAAKPLFDDPALGRPARMIEDGETKAFQKSLPSLPREVVHSKELLWFAIQEASSGGYRADEKLQCLRMLLDAGAPLDSLLVQSNTSVLSAAANTGNAAVLRLLFERGAGPNVPDPYFNRPYIFDAIISHIAPLASVQAFLEFGADPNATALFDDEDGPIPPLLRAAQFDRWDICAALVEKGARPDFTTPNGKSCAFYMAQAADSIRKYGSPESQAAFARLESLLGVAH